MISLTKNEIAECLKDYAMLSEQIRVYPNINIYNMFKCISVNQPEKQSVEYLTRMIRVYGMVTYMRLFSFIEDFAIDCLNDDELDFSLIKEQIFVNKEDAKAFSNKQIIRFIRNAFNHSDGAKELYRLSVNGRFIEIDLKNSKPKPFHVKLNFEQLQAISDEIFENRHNMFLTTFNEKDFDDDRPYLRKNLEKLELLKIYFPKKIDSSIIDKFDQIDFGEYSHDELLEIIENILKSSNVQYEMKFFPINEEQISSLKKRLKPFKDISKLIGDEKNIRLYNKFRATYIRAILYETIPLGLAKEQQLNFEIKFVTWLMADTNLTYSEIDNILEDIASAKPYVEKNYQNEEYKRFDKKRYNDLRNYYGANSEEDGYGYSIGLNTYNKDYNTRVAYPLITYIGYVINDIMDCEEIVIDGKKYNKEHVRDSIVHGRWFLRTNEIIELYDCPNGIYNDYNFDWHETMNLRSLLAFVENKDNRKRL